MDFKDLSSAVTNTPSLLPSMGKTGLGAIVCKTAHVRFRAKAGTHSAFGEGSHTAAYTPKHGPSLPRPQRGLELPVKFLLVRHAFIYIHFPVLCGPSYRQKRKSRQSCRHKFYPQPFLIPLFNFSHKWPTFTFTGESGYTLAFANRIAHNGLHAETGGVSDGVLLLPSDCFARFGNPVWPGIRPANFAAFGSWPGVLLKNAESLRDSDAFMRVAVPQASRPRWAALPCCAVRSV